MTFWPKLYLTLWFVSFVLAAFCPIAAIAFMGPSQPTLSEQIAVAVGRTAALIFVTLTLVAMVGAIWL